MKKGQVGFVHKVAISPVASARLKAGLSESQFAELLGVSVRTLMDWERGKLNPAGAAKNLIAIAATHPDVLHCLDGMSTVARRSAPAHAAGSADSRRSEHLLLQVTLVFQPLEIPEHLVDRINLLARDAAGVVELAQQLEVVEKFR
jgi:transcriptional regulator with XRE-family HTH domain